MSNPYEKYGISEKTAALTKEAMDAVLPVFARIDELREANELRVLDAFRRHKFSEVHLGKTTGYGYDDIGREKLEEIFADLFGAEKAYVRMQISSGTQAISSILYGVLRPGDKMLSVTGRPYDTLLQTIGIGEGIEYDATLKDYGISYDEVDLLPDGTPDLEAIEKKLDKTVKMVFLQKSRGYSARRALLTDDIEKVVKVVRKWSEENKHDIVIAVDNCYGEFTETREPCSVGVDICGGSLIKNPGGGLCPTGGYIAGREDLVEKVAQRITAPGLGSHVGPTLGFNQTLARGLFTAPAVVSECLKSAIFAAQIFEMSGYAVSPKADEARGDIVQTITFNDGPKMVKFCQMIQQCSPVDSFVNPEPYDMPGYDDLVVMAAGAFVQGATTELSCDGPMREPYIAYMQGGLVYEQAKLASMLVIN